MPNAWTTSRVYVDELGTNPARSALLAGLNTPISLLSYVGHSAPTQWSFDPLLTTGDVNASSGGMADLVVQWGCWNSYFVRPAANTLAHSFLLAPGRGAAAVIGVSSLTELSAHTALGNVLFPELAVGTRIGDAFRLAKMQLATEGATWRDILMTATLLGDPAQPVR